MLILKNWQMKGWLEKLFKKILCWMDGWMGVKGVLGITYVVQIF